ncbi:MAG: hypothetical protein ACE5H8_14835 [Alphaproteobacteria bacterium]
MMRRLALVLGIVFAVLHGAPAAAQAVCGERATFVAFLEENYAEQPVALGITAEGRLIELLTSPSGSWTMLVTYPNGPTCMVASGENWEELPPPVAGEVS